MYEKSSETVRSYFRVLYPQVVNGLVQLLGTGMNNVDILGRDPESSLYGLGHEDFIGEPDWKDILFRLGAPALCILKMHLHLWLAIDDVKREL